jgi:rod shape-determining protein MreD
MRNAAFLGVGLGLLVVQANVFRAFDGMSVSLAVTLWLTAVLVDVVRTSRGFRGAGGQPSSIATIRLDFTLPATVLLGYVMLVSVAHAKMGRPIPAVVLPLILYLGVHEYSLPRGAGVAFALGYATDVLAGAPVGLYTFTYVATFVLSRAAGLRLAAQTGWMQVLLVCAFSLVQSTMVLVLMAIFGGDPWVPRTLYPLALPSALATASVAPLVFRVAQGIDLATAASSPRAEAGARAMP